MDMRYAVSPREAAKMDTDALRETFLVSNLFQTNQLMMTYTHHDRLIIGGAVPRQESLVLEHESAIKTQYFLERRELAVINLGKTGTVRVDDDSFVLEPQDCLYVGQGKRRITFESGDGTYYLVSAPAHRSYPTQMVTLQDAFHQHLGDRLHSNERTIYRLVHQDGMPSAQLVLGLTRLEPGNMWNTMPAHTHDRRTEIYLYFDLDEADRVVHLLGTPTESRHLVVANEEAVISPGWSIHSGVGTRHYAFIWAMAGENYDYSDMEVVPAAEIR